MYIYTVLLGGWHSWHLASGAVRENLSAVKNNPQSFLLEASYRVCVSHTYITRFYLPALEDPPIDGDVR